MNWLAHVALAPPEPAWLAGALAADFLRGEPGARPAPVLQAGVAHHRLVDRFTDTDPDVRAARRSLHPSLGHLRPVVLDLLFDHFLALRFDRWGPEPLEVRTARTYRALSLMERHLPERLRAVRRRMEREDWLGRYGDRDALGRALDGIGRRLRRARSLRWCVSELDRVGDRLEEHFARFYPRLRARLEPEGAARPEPAS